MTSEGAIEGVRTAGLDADLAATAQEALRSWFPSATIVVSPLSPGLSGAALLRTDISGDVDTDSAGVFVLKIEVAGEPSEPTQLGEEVASKVAPAFAEAHIPRVRQSWRGPIGPDSHGRARLLEIAGGSLRRYTTGARRGSTSLLDNISAVISAVANAWAYPTDVDHLSPREMLEESLGGARSAQALKLADEFFPYGIRHENGHTFLSPGRIMESASRIPLLRSFEHGDLHAGNLMIPLEVSEDQADFWLIDFERARPQGLFGLDLVYLELGLLTDFFSDVSYAALAGCLNYAEFPQRRFPVPDDLQWLAQFMRSSRDAIRAFAETLTGRSDDIERQMLLARISEALRWARRHPGRRKSHLALIYAGYYATHYERTYPGSAENRPFPTPEPDALGHDELTPAEADVWNHLWANTYQLSRRDCMYILVAERLAGLSGLGALGNLPWSAIVDLDPGSDQDGLFSQAGPVLAASRAVHIYSTQRPATDDRRGTLWLMSGGWQLRGEAFVDFRQWFRTRLRGVRELFAALRDTVGDDPVVLVVALGSHAASDAAGHDDRILRVVEASDEIWGDRASVHIVGETDPAMTVPSTFYPLRPPALVGQIAATYGSEDAVGEYRLPATNGPVIIHQETLQVLREHLDILHDRILVSPSDDQSLNDAFWRGGQILWSELAEDIDIPRDVAPQLLHSLTDSLEHHRTRTVVLQHRPGSGGTTAALRAAWDLHRTYPVAILRTGKTMTVGRVRLLADRLHRLFVLTDRPVLMVADSGDLPEAHRESLYRELAARNARITLLYVRRVASFDSEQLAVSEPLSAHEGRLFLARFRQLTDDPERVSELELLAADPYSRFRTPFFYGLITYQRGFTKLSDYVSYHVRAVAGRARDVLTHLALVTMYSTAGLQWSLIQRLFRLSHTSVQLSIEELFADSAALIIQRGGRYRIAHQLVAEELLTRLVGAPDLRLQLSNLSHDLIDDLASIGGEASEPLRLLFRQIFTDRVSAIVDGAEDRGRFSPLIEDLDAVDPSVGHQVLRSLVDALPDEPHFWNHLGRHQIYRLRRDFDLAEQYLERAIALSPADALHHHTLGLARRARLRQGLRSAEGQGVEAVLAVVDAWYYRTVECFDRARALAPDDIYGYITHVQSMLDTARALRAAARVQTVAELSAAAGEWVVEHLTIANTLLEDASQLFGTLDREDDYLHRCLADIQRLYGDLDAVVRLWEISQVKGRSTAYSRRALAQAYFVRANRTWRGLTAPELRRIVTLAEENLHRSGARDEDYRLWFEARKLLNDFDVEEALAHLELWSSRVPSWRAAFYRYVIHFYLWFSERSGDAHGWERALDECHRLAPGRSNHSHAWLGGDPAWCPLVADSDLGEWDRRKNFWQDTALLKRVNGVIDFIEGPASGSVAIGDSGVRAFFVPSVGGFMADADENARVNFFLGFSPSGLRAWGVERGAHDDAITRRGEILSLPSFVSRPRSLDYDAQQAARVAQLNITRIRELSITVAEAALSRGASISIASLEDRVLATIGLEAASDLRDGMVRRLILSQPSLAIDVAGDVELVRRRTADEEQRAPREDQNALGYVSYFDRRTGWGWITSRDDESLRFTVEDLVDGPTRDGLRRNSVVRFMPSRERRESRALRIEVLPEEMTLAGDALLSADELRVHVAAEVRTILEAALANGNASLTAAALEDHLEQKFRGALPLGRRLEHTGIRAFLRSLDWLKVQGAAGTQMVVLRSSFGATRSDRSVDAIEPDTDAIEIAASVQAAYEIVASQHREVTLQALGAQLKLDLGESAYRQFLAGRRLRQALEDLGEWTLTLEREGVVSMRPRDSAATPRLTGGDSSEPQSTTNELRELVRAAYGDLSANDEAVPLTKLGSHLVLSVGRQRYDALLDGQKLRFVLESLGEWNLTESPEGSLAIQPRE